MKNNVFLKEIFDKTILEEQETLVNISYADKCTDVYTSKKSVYFRLLEKLGEPTKKFYLQNRVSGASWVIPFSDKQRTGYALSRPLLIGNIGNTGNEDETDEESEE